MESSGLPQITADGLEARLVPATLVAMQDRHLPPPAADAALSPGAATVSSGPSGPSGSSGSSDRSDGSGGNATSTEGWVGTEPAARRAVLAWVAARSGDDEPHLLGVTAVGEDSEGAVLVRRPCASGTPLPEALDRIGGLTRGVAVTLSLPLLDLAAAGATGALVLGSITAEDVLVDDSGAPLVVDRVPGSTGSTGGTGSTGSTSSAGSTGRTGGAGSTRGTGGTGARPRADAPSAAPGAAAGVQHAAASGPRRHRLVGHRRAAIDRHSDADGVCGLVTVVRSIWDRVDPRDAHRAVVDRAVADARGGAVEAIEELAAAVTAAGPPRPVRWVPVPSVFDFLPTPEPPPTTGLGAVLTRVTDTMHDGVPVGGGRFLRPRVLLSGVCVVAGLVVAGTVLGQVP